MAGSEGTAALPIIDVGPLLGDGPAAARAEAAGRIQAACRDRGFFYVAGHGVPAGLLDQLANASAEFFALPPADKLQIAMERGGRAWRGFFPVGAELTSGRPDLKEGLYFGAELPDDDPRVLAGVPLHGRNLFPRQVPRMRPLVLAYLDAMAAAGPGRADRGGAEPGPGPRVLRHRLHRGPDDLVPDLPLPAVTAADLGLGSGRAHRLRADHLARPG